MPSLDPAQIDVVLVRPARPANVALACRALKAMGLRRLVLVEDAGGAAHEESRRLAHGAWDVFDGARRVAGLTEALAGSVFVAATSGKVREGEVWTPRRLAREGAERAAGGRMSLVFGPEATGLRRDEIRQCHATVAIPTHEGQPSLNLAQAVLVLAYELRLASLEAPPAEAAAPSPDEDARASVAEMEEALAAFRAAGLGIGYLNPQAPDHLLGEWRRLLARAAPSRREVNLMRGLARQMEFAAAAVARERRAAG